RPEGPRRGRQAFALHVPRPPPAATASSFTYAQRPPGHDGARLAEPSVTERCSAELARLRFVPNHRHPTHRRRISAALPHLGEEPKKSRRVLCQGVRAKYAFMRAHSDEFRLCAMCRVLEVHRSGYYAWLRNGLSTREREDHR